MGFSDPSNKQLLSVTWHVFLIMQAERPPSQRGKQEHSCCLIWNYEGISERCDGKQMCLSQHSDSTLLLDVVFHYTEQIRQQYHRTPKPWPDGSISLASSELLHAKPWAAFYKHHLVWESIAFRLMWTPRLVKSGELALKGTATQRRWRRIQSHTITSSEHERLSQMFLWLKKKEEEAKPHLRDF